MSDSPLRLATFAPLKCKPKWIFLSQQAGTKIRENEPFSLTKNASFASIFLSLSSSIVLSQQVPSDKSRQHNRVSPFPIKLQQTNHHRKQKKQANLACCFFLLFARCILISYSVNLISRHTNRTSNLTDRILFAV